MAHRVTVTPHSGQTGGGLAVASQGTVELDTGRADLTSTIGDRTLRTVLIGATLYQETRPPDLVADGGSWLELDPTVGTREGNGGLQRLLLLQAQPSYPLEDLRYVRGAERVTAVGEDRVRGDRTTRYRAMVDLPGAAGSSSAERGSAGRELARRFGVKSIAVEVWIDDHQRVRRLDRTLELSDASRAPEQPARPIPARVEASLELFDFGTPVAVTIPPPEEVADADEPAADTGLADPGGSGTPSAATDALEVRLLRSLPPAYQRQPDSVADTGPSDFEKAVRDEDSPDGRQLLTSAGFVAGYQRLWADGEEGAVVDFVYQFHSEAGAREYFRRAVSRATEETSVGSVVAFAVPGVPDATGLRRSGPDGHGTAVFVARGPYVAQIVVQGPDAASPDLAVRLAQEQYLLLR